MKMTTPEKHTNNPRQNTVRETTGNRGYQVLNTVDVDESINTEQYLKPVTLNGRKWADIKDDEEF